MYKILLEKIYDSIENKGIITNISTIELKPESMIDVVRDRVVKTKAFRDFYTMKTATEFVSDYLANLDAGVDKSLINKLLLAYLNQNVIYSEDLTKQSEEQALAAISLTFGMVQKDELIISEGELITDEKYKEFLGLGPDYIIGNLTPAQMFRYFVAPLYMEMAKADVLDVEEFKKIGNYQMGLK